MENFGRIRVIDAATLLLLILSVRACARELALIFCSLGEASRGIGLTAWTATHAGVFGILADRSQSLSGLHDGPVVMVGDQFPGRVGPVGGDPFWSSCQLEADGLP